MKNAAGANANEYSTNRIERIERIQTLFTYLNNCRQKSKTWTHCNGWTDTQCAT